MSSVNTNGAAMAAIRSLSTIARDMATTQSRVDSGLSWNNANEDTAVFAIAQTMRGDLNAMTAVRDSLAFGKAALTVARDAATKISDELNRLKQTVLQGQQQGINKAQIDEQITNALANIDAFARSATFNGVNLLVGTTTPPGVQFTNLDIVRDIQGAQVNLAGVNRTAQGLGIAGLEWNTGGARLTFDDSLAPADGETVTVEIDGQTYVFEFDDGASGLGTQPAPGTQVFDVQIESGDSPLTLISKLIDRMQGAGISASLNNQGELIIGGNVNDATFATDITGATASILPPGQRALAAVNGAIDLIGTTLARLGADLRQVEGLSEFTKQLTDSVKEGLGALVDADLAEESARLTSLQTKQQLAVQSLSIANQQSQALLSLFR
ncbi:MAG: flagellin [Acetobacteraceae bacterium]|nr:flagellin [Acetobacteraceae bacterium]